MKKLLPTIAMSFVLSGCLNSVSLPNTNTQKSSNSYELHYLGLGMGMAEVCKYVNPKMEKGWARYQDSAFKIIKSYNQNDIQFMWGISMARFTAAYMSKNNIPFRAKNVLDISNQMNKDKRLKKEIIKEAVVAMKGTKDCFNLNSSEKSLKEFATKIGKGHLL